jgi:riboflavin-specific deaminase-like protein
MRILLPEQGETSVADQLSGYQPWELGPADRPFTAINFVATVDGRATIAGRSGPIGSDTDTEMLQRLRTRFDAVLIGAGTMRTERYGRIVSDPELRAERELTGLARDPLAVIVSGSLDLPWDAGLFTDGSGRVLIFTDSDREAPQTATPVELVRRPGGVEIAAAFRHLRTECGIRALLCEGGPRLFAEMQEAGVVDELFLTIAPKLAGGPAPRILEGELSEISEMELVWLLDSDGELFARYRVAR